MHNLFQSEPLGIKKLQRYHFRLNSYIPPAQISRAQQALLQSLFFAAAKFDALLIDDIHQTHDGAHAFSAEISGAIDYRIHRIQEIAIPGLLQPRPIALNGVVLAVVRRVVNQPNTEPGQIRKLCHA